ncbi:hypothetical protein BT63DRAFT_178519 [Microthyrium microscopicum]|uniref:Uncharacterized protein n=1 Tax=Microthyrium microscopicum TaxID=703497 RepID=A0A6A6UHI1_9PEZI|nr:hypothetical protein BT63DRAFT_178519 [Microthyrium microscopicum]
MDPPAGAQIFNLVAKSSDPKANNQPLSVQGGKVGIFSGAKAGVFWSSPYDEKKTLSFHTNDDTHQIALKGSNGILDLIDVVNPTGDMITTGTSMEWSTFAVDGQGGVTVSDGADIPSRKWIAYQDGRGMTVALYDGFTDLKGKTVIDITLAASSPS